MVEIQKLQVLRLPHAHNFVNLSGIKIALAQSQLRQHLLYMLHYFVVAIPKSQWTFTYSFSKTIPSLQRRWKIRAF